MANPSEKTPYQITESDAVSIWKRHWSGEYQHHIAASFGVNPGRVNDVIKGRKHAGSEELAMRERAAV